MANILVVGGTGTVGTAVVYQLLKDGHQVRLITRNLGKAVAKFGEKVDIIEGDVMVSQQVENALQGMDVVLSSLSSPPGKKNITLTEYSGNLTVIESCKLKNVKRFLYVSALNAEYFAGYYRFFVKYRVEEELKISGLSYTIFRPTIFMETIPKFVDKGKIVVYGEQPNPINFLAVSDFAMIVSNSIGKLDCIGKIFDVLGPEALTLDTVFGMYQRYRRPNLKITHSSPRWGQILGLIQSSSHSEYSELIALMIELNQNAQKGDPTITNSLLGAPTTRFHDWLLNL
jgi:uncharacterized protein YbjT (DUF2867 family)